jgi:hypothetical protein
VYKRQVETVNNFRLVFHRLVEESPGYGIADFELTFIPLDELEDKIISRKITFICDFA